MKETKLHEIKTFKFLEMMTEAIPQFIFNIYLLTEFGINSDNLLFNLIPHAWIKIFSLGVSYLTITTGISQALVTHFGRFTCGFWDLIKCICFVIVDITLLLLMIASSLIIYGPYLILPIIGIMMSIGMIIQYCITDNELGRSFSDDKAEYLLRIPLFVLTNVPTNRSTHTKEAIAINKIITNFTVCLGLFSSTMLLRAPNILDIKYFGHLNNGTMPHNCENYCDYECDDFVITVDTCLILVYVNWALLAISCLQGTLDYFDKGVFQGYRKYLMEKIEKSEFLKSSSVKSKRSIITSENKAFEDGEIQRGVTSEQNRPITMDIVKPDKTVLHWEMEVELDNGNDKKPHDNDLEEEELRLHRIKTENSQNRQDKSKRFSRQDSIDIPTK